jgi:hypothetical protein
MKKIFVILTSLLFFTETVSADRVCMRVVRNKLVKRAIPTGACPRGFIEVIDTAQLRGPAGANGADGSVLVWGDGSDGDFVGTGSGEGLDPTKQYRNITILADDSDDELSIDHGSTIRCSGTLTIQETFRVSIGKDGAAVRSVNGPTRFLSSTRDAQPGIAGGAAISPECTASSIAASGADTTSGASEGGNITRVSRAIFGGSGSAPLSGSGGDGGGSVAIYCKLGITIAPGATLLADGGSGFQGAGGGGGGLIVLASNGVISNQGRIAARGGRGGASTATACAGGGGGGGLVHFIAPTVSNTGEVLVTAGSTGNSSITPNSSTHCGGGAGGASIGGGGGGATKPATTGACSFASVDPASDGEVITTTVAGGNVEGLLL